MDSYVRIILDNYDNETYFSGQTIVGKVECYFASETTIKAIRIKFKGRAKNAWDVEKYHRHDEEVYFDETYNLFGGIAGEENIQIPIGKHTYPFSYILPSGPLPTVFKNILGNIKYKIEAVVDIPWARNIEDQFPFYITTPLNLNHLPESRNLKVPYSQSIDEVIGCWCIGSGHIKFSVSLPFTGYAIGQQVDVSFHVQNMSDITIQRVIYRIQRRDHHIMPKHHAKRYKTSDLAKLVLDPIRAHSEKSGIITLHVPTTEIGNLEPCSIINCSYQLYVELVLPFPNANLKMFCPLMFGTVPLVDNNQL